MVRVWYSETNVERLERARDPGRYRVARCTYDKRCGGRKNPTFGKQFVNFL
jgi:hypothetical protein